MPELPEVETVRAGLEPVMVGRRFLEVEQRRADLRFAMPERFVERVRGARLEKLGRRGKYLVGALDRGETLVMHLGMTGRFTIETGVNDPARPGAFHAARGGDPRHDHIVFLMEGGHRVTFNDARRFGFMDLAPTDQLDNAPPFARMGPEPLSDAFDADALLAALAGKRTPIKAALLDQSVVAGQRKIYLCEALCSSGVRHRRLARTVGRGRAERLVADIKDVLGEAIEAGGSSLRDYAHTDGTLGYFQHGFAVYDRAGEACARASCPGAIQRLVQSGRSTFFCAACQR